MNRKNKTTFLSLAAAALLASGCVSMPLSPERPTNERTQTKTTVVGAKLKEFQPKVERTGSSVVVRVDASGNYTVKTETTRSYDVPAREMLSVGLFPGLANVPAEDLAGDALLALWFNVCFAGMPTANGLLVEPFNPASEASKTFGGPGAFSRAAIVGFHKYMAPPRYRVDGGKKEKTEKRNEVRPVEDVKLDLEPDGEPQFWSVKQARLGEVVLSGVSAGSHKALLKVSGIPADHPYGGELELLEGVSVTIPE